MGSREVNSTSPRVYPQYTYQSGYTHVGVGVNPYRCGEITPTVTFDQIPVSYDLIGD
jgi:hypothetical protein